jgi:hypothetical protein
MFDTDQYLYTTANDSRITLRNLTTKEEKTFNIYDSKNLQIMYLENEIYHAVIAKDTSRIHMVN